MASRLSGKIAFASGKIGDYDIWSLDLSNGQLTQLTHGKFWNDKPSWSPDGQWVAYVSNQSGQPEIFKVSADGSKATQLTQLNRWADCPKFSSDGKMIAFISNQAGDNDIWIMDPDGRNKKQITAYEGSDNSVTWSHDGKCLLCSCDQDNQCADIWRMDLASGQKEQLTTDRSMDITPASSPTGQLIAFVSNRPLDPVEKDILRDSDKDIWIMNHNGSKQLGITQNQGTDFCPCWSPDGRYILYVASSDFSAGRLRLIDVSAIAAAYQTGDIDQMTDAAIKIRSEKLELDRKPLENEINAQRHRSLITWFLPDNWAKHLLYPVEYFGSERYPDWAAHG